MKLSENVNYVLNKLNDEGYEAYIVGGACRDIIMGKKPNDWDIATSALPAQIKEVFSEHRTIDTGIGHGTVTVVIDDTFIETTTFRIDGEYTDGRRPDTVEFVDDVCKDLARRDFTMNAIAYNPHAGFIDPYNGVKDIENKIIRCVGSPSLRFYEDGLRIMRAMRFSAQLDFDIESQTSFAMRNSKNLLNGISAERIQSELCKILESNHCGNKVLKRYSDIASIIIPEIEDMIFFDQKCSYQEYDLWEHILHCMDYFCEMNYEPDNNGIILRLATLLHDIGKPHCEIKVDNRGYSLFLNHADVSAKMAYKILRRLKFSNEIVGYTTQLISYHMTGLLNGDKTNVKKLLNKIGEEQFRRLIELRSANFFCGTKLYMNQNKMWCDVKYAEFILDEVLTNDECYSLKQLAINGDDLLEYGIPEGKQIKYALDLMLNMVIYGCLDNDRDTLLKTAESIVDSNLSFINGKTTYLQGGCK